MSYGDNCAEHDLPVGQCIECEREENRRLQNALSRSQEEVEKLRADRSLENDLELKPGVLTVMRENDELKQKLQAAEAEVELLRDKVKRFQQKFPVALTNARMAGRKSAKQSWEEAHAYGKEQKRLRAEDNATFTAEIMRLEEQLTAAEARAAQHLADQELLVARERKRVAGVFLQLITECPDMTCQEIAGHIRTRYGLDVIEAGRLEG